MNVSAATLLFVVLPYTVESDGDTSKKGVRSFLAFPYGVLTMATYVRNNAPVQPKVHILDLNLYAKEQLVTVLSDHISRLNPSLIGISFSFDVSYRYVSLLTQAIKKLAPSLLVVMGGPAATVSYEEILTNQPHIDAVCYGEGDVAMLRLAMAGDDHLPEALQQDPWITRASLQAGRTPCVVTVPHLNDVIEVDYTLVEQHRYSMKEAFSPNAVSMQHKPHKQFFLVTSRGCPFKCVFCAEPSFHGKVMRYADIDVIIAHIEHLVSQHGMTVLTLYDDQLLLNQIRAKELFRRLIPFKLRIEMPNGVTVSFIDQELAMLMSQAGVSTISLAIESGSEYVLRHIIKKPIRLSKVKPVVDLLHDNNIFVQAFFINGFPGEREQDRQKTVDFIIHTGIDWSLFSFATPLRGSELYKICKANDWIDKDYLQLGDIDMTVYVIRAPGLDAQRISEQNYLMNLELNFVHNYRMRMGDYQVAARCFLEVHTRHPGHPFASWFLARAKARLGHDPKEILALEDEYFSVIGKHEKWRHYASLYQLPMERALAS